MILLGAVLLIPGGCSQRDQTVRSTRALVQEPVRLDGDAVLIEVAEAKEGDMNETAVVTVVDDAAVVARPRVRTEEPSPTKPLPAVAPEVRARELLLQAAGDDWALLRANAIEALMVRPDLLEPVATLGLLDDNRGVRFVSLMAIGRCGLCDLSDAVEASLDDPSESVRAAAIYALHACDRVVNPGPLGEMAFSSDPEVRGNAFMILGLLGEPSAAGLIRAAVGQETGLVDPARVRLIDLQAAAALVRLGDLREIDPIRAALFAPTDQAELTALSIQLIAQLNDEGARQMLVRLVEAPTRESRPPEIRLSAAETIAALGARDPAPLLRLASEYVESPRPEIRAQVASLLGEADDGASRALLVRLMEDPNPIVRISAAGSTLKLAGDEQTDGPALH